MFTKPLFLLRMEGATILLLSILLYRHIHASWLLFVILLLTPDLFMLGYLINVRAGAALYNLVYTLLTPGVLFAVCFFTGKMQFVPLLLIWTAHIGFDRVLGFGLKYPTQFKDTHLQRV